MSLKARLSLMFFGGILVSSLAVSASLLWLGRGETRLQAMREPGLVLDSAAKMAEESLLAEDPMMLMSYLGDLMENREALAGARVRREGTWIAVKAPARKKLPPQDLRLVLSKKASIRLKGEARETEVELTFSRGPLERRSRELFNDSAKSAVIIIFLVALLGLPLSIHLAGRFLAPVNELEGAIDRVAAGESHEAIPVRRDDELGRLTSRFNRMWERLGELDAMKTAFVKSVTHDLKSPLGAIESYARNLAQESDLDDAGKENLAHIETNARRLREYIINLLEISRIERGMLDISPREMDLAEMIRDTVLFFGPRAREAGLKLAFELERGKLPVTADPERIQQVLNNLVGNAMKFTRDGSVTVYAKKKDDLVEVGVIDTGIGIEEKDLKRLFQRFTRIETPFQTDGSGLGLSIAKTIVELHGGGISVESEPGTGSRFFFTLPSRRGEGE